MTRSSMALGRRCAASLTRKNPSRARIWSRGFSASIIRAEDENPQPKSPRAQARIDAAEAIGSFARSRVARPNEPTTWRKVQLSSDNGTPTSSPGFRNPSSRPPISGSSPPQRPYRSRGGPPRSGSRTNSAASRTNARRRPRRIASEEDHDDEDRLNKEEEEEDNMTPEEEMDFLKSMGHEPAFQIKPSQGPHLDMASLMLEYAPKHFGATEPATGKYPAMTDEKRRGLLQNIVRQVRKNETYTEKDIEQMAKILGPAMPRA